MKSIGRLLWVALMSCLFSSALSVKADPALVRHAPSLGGSVDGALQQLLGESVTVNGGAVITGDLLVPGSPNVLLNGKPTYDGTVDGTGSIQPSNYQITLNAPCSLRHILRRSDAVAMPTVASPATPLGTRSVTINSAGQGIGDSATLKNLALNGNVGQVILPPGTYGTFSANSGSGFVLGVAGSNEASIYNLQGLTLNQGAQVQVVGPVVLNLAKGFTINGNIGNAASPGWLVVNVSSGSVVLNGGVAFYGILTAPSSSVTLNGNSQLVGNLACDRLTVNSGALLRISASGSNLAPVVSLISPVEGFVVASPAEIKLSAVASDGDGTVVKVEFFNGTTKLGESVSLPYEYLWSAVPVGTYSLTAVATDDRGGRTISMPVGVQVTQPNAGPTVSLVNPVGGSVVSGPASITLSASAADSDGSVSKVEFFNGETRLGELSSAPFDFIWSNVPAGAYSVYAKATDNQGVSATSSVVPFVVNARPTANALSLATTTGVSVEVNLTSVDLEGDALAYALSSNPGHGSLSGTLPTLRYTSEAGFVGTDAFSFTVHDAYGASQAATVTIRVQAPAIPPVAKSVLVDVQVGASVPFILHGSDAAGAPLLFSLATGPALGSVQQGASSGESATWTYTAGAVAGVDTFTFTVSNGQLVSAPASIRVRVLPLPPVADGLVGHAGGIVRDASTLQPLDGVVVRVAGIPGAILSGADGQFMLPVSHFGQEAAQSIVVVYEAPGYISTFRRVTAYPEVPVTVDPVFLKKMDAKVTMITSAGGTATNAAGDVQVEFPAGAVGGSLGVQLTNYSAGRELPGHLPQSSAFTYAVDLSPNGASFSSPVTVKIANILGFAANTPIPVGLFNPETVRWEPESMGVVSSDGQWVVCQVTHFSTRDCNVPAWRGPVDISSVSNQINKRAVLEERDPGISIARGSYETDIDLPAYRSFGAEHSIKLRYESEAATGQKLFSAKISNGRFTASPLARVFGVSINGKNFQSTYMGESQNYYGSFLGGARVDLRDLPTGVYPYSLSVSNLYASTYGTSSVFGGSAESDTGVKMREAIPYTSTCNDWLPWVNLSNSPYGVGWSLQGMSHVYGSSLSPRVMLLSGSSDWESFDAVGGLSRTNEVAGSFGAGPVFSVRKDYAGGLLVAHGSGITRVSADKQQISVVDGVGGKRVVDFGSGSIGLEAGGIVDIAESESGTIFVIAHIDSPDASSKLQETGLYRLNPGAASFDKIAGDLSRPLEVQVDAFSRIYVFDEADLSIWRYDTAGNRERLVADVDGFIGMVFDAGSNRLVYTTRQGVYCMRGDGVVQQFTTGGQVELDGVRTRPVLFPNGDIQVVAHLWC